MPSSIMEKLKNPVRVTYSGKFINRRFSRHPERYMEIYRVLRKHELHHVAAQFMMAHRHEDEDEEAGLDGHLIEAEDHAEDLASALEELGPSWIKLGQLL